MMPKRKTSRGAAKRFNLTKGGKIKRRKACDSHLLTKKTTKRKRNLRRNDLISPADKKKVKRLIPYA
jgi:large subunit ribosomal protein L35